MTRMLSFIGAATLALALAGAAGAQQIDKNGRCHDASGKFAKMAVCQTVKAAQPTHCRNAKTGKFAKCGAPGAVPLAAPAAPHKKP
jgi:hypothetical protein